MLDILIFLREYYYFRIRWIVSKERILLDPILQKSIFDNTNVKTEKYH